MNFYIASAAQDVARTECPANWGQHVSICSTTTYFILSVRASHQGRDAGRGKGRFGSSEG
eukprot:384670-Pelagomonas_calceolata.AAC.3